MNGSLLLYHGSTLAVSSPLANIGRQELDFGPGFYLTADREQAEKWAVTKAKRKPNAHPVLCISNQEILDKYFHFVESVEL